VAKAIVVGAGHNGLTAACYLAKAGYSVVVLEAQPGIGGMTSTAALVPDAPDHLLSPCAIDAVYWRASPVEHELGLRRHGLQVIDHDPAWGWLGPSGESLVVGRDVNRTIDEIARFSAADAQKYREFSIVVAKALAIQDSYAVDPANRPSWRTAVAAIRGLTDRRVRRLLGAALTTSAAELIEESFESLQMRGIFASMASILGSITGDSSGIGLMATGPLHRYGVGRPVGGMQAIADSLAACLQAAGGEIHVDAQVEQIVIAGGRASGVRLADGRQFDADQVVAAVPPHVTARLLQDSDVTGLEALSRAPANSAGIGCLTIGMALRGKLDIARHQAERKDGLDLRRPSLFYGTLEDVLRGEAQARAGQAVVDPPWTATILSATDPTQAPDGQDNLYLYAPTPTRPQPDWATVQPAAEKELLASADRVINGVCELEIGRFVETPADLAIRLGAENGCIYHVDQTVTRLGPLRPGWGWGKHTTSVTGLALSGAGTHPGGGVSGIPGRLAAHAVLRSDKRNRR
jgi:phytoene dehydrogenase-like protein